MKNNTEISERILQIIDFLSINPNKLSKKLGYDRTQTIYDIINCKSAPSFDFFNRLYNSEYSELINPIWLLTGKGNIVRYGSPLEPGIVSELKSSYDINCKFCAEKERIIEALHEANYGLRAALDVYKKKEKNKGSVSNNEATSEPQK
ncbi:MAG: hypothetical protein WC865_13530 [Bacteroidales bacterium]